MCIAPVETFRPVGGHRQCRLQTLCRDPSGTFQQMRKLCMKEAKERVFFSFKVQRRKRFSLLRKLPKLLGITCFRPTPTPRCPQSSAASPSKLVAPTSLHRTSQPSPRDAVTPSPGATSIITGVR